MGLTSDREEHSEGFGALVIAQWSGHGNGFYDFAFISCIYLMYISLHMNYYII